MAITYDDTTVASNPGGIKLDRTKFLHVHQITGTRKTMYHLLLKMKPGMLNKLFPNNPIIHNWISLSEQFLFGCANPTIIINESAGIYATYTDLTNDGGTATPVIKIVKMKRSEMAQHGLKNQEKTVTVAFYSRNLEHPNARSWADFNPVLPHLYSTDNAAIITLQKKIKAPAWECLQRGLTQIDNPEKPGLYHIQLPDELTKNAY